MVNQRTSLSTLALLLFGCAGAEDGTANDLLASEVPTSSSSNTSATPSPPPGPSAAATPGDTTPDASASSPTPEPSPSPNDSVPPAEPEPIPQGSGGFAPEPGPSGGGAGGTPPQSGDSGGGGTPPGGGGSSGGEAPSSGGGSGPTDNNGGAASEEAPDPVEALDCGPNAFVIESAGPPGNRVNYVIAGDGYSAEELETTYLEHIAYAMEKRFSDPIGQPYLRYRKFVNICAVKVVSSSGICGNSALGCCGDDQSRLANCDRQASFRAMEEALADVPDFDIDWTAVVLNGDSWWNTGSDLMLWSGGNQDAHGAALHEGGHGFHQLADEYDGTNGGCDNEYNEVNSTADSSDGNPKWGAWLGFEQSPGTGMQDFFEGSRYCQAQQFRPSDNSMMNMLFGDNEDTSFNPVSREKMIFDFWRFVQPVDSTEPPAGETSTTLLRVNVIDPEVIDVNWSVDGMLVEEDGGAEFDASTLGAGTYEVTAFAFDNAGEDLVRYREGGDFGRMNWERSQQEVRWTVTVP